MHSVYPLLGYDRFLSSTNSDRYLASRWPSIIIALGFLAVSCLLPIVSSAASLFEIFQANPKNVLIAKTSDDSCVNSAEIEQTVKSWREQQRAAEREREACQRVIEKFPQQLAELQRKLALLDLSPAAAPQPHLNTLERQQQMLQTSDALVVHNQRLQNLTADMHTSMVFLESISQKITEIRKGLDHITVERRTFPASSNHIATEEELLQAKRQYQAARLKNLECLQIKSQNELEIKQLEVDYVYKQHQLLDRQQQINQQELAGSSEVAVLNSELVQCLQRNREYSSLHSNQKLRLKEVQASQLQVTHDIRKVKQEITRIVQLSPSLSSFPALREMLRARILKLTKLPNLQPITYEIAQLNVQRLRYEDTLQNEEKPFKTVQIKGRFDRKALEKELAKKYQLLAWLTRSSDTTITAYNQLKDANIELIQAQQQLQKVADRHLFWATDVSRASLASPVNIARDINKLLQRDIQLFDHLKASIATGDNIGVFAIALILAILGWSARHRYGDFLQQAATRIGNVTHDSFSLTASTVAYSLLTTLPLPILVMAIGYCLKDFTGTVAAGVLATVPLLWALGICAGFSHPQGLFIKHFGWEQQRVARVVRHYMLTVWLAVPLLITTIVFNHLDNRQFAGTLGRASFILLCTVLTVFTLSINRASLTFYRNHRGLEQNIINHAVWAVLISAPLLAIFFSALGYLAAAQELLLRLAGSVGIWFSLLIIYRLVWRWMLIQRRRIAFERAKQRRAGKLAQRAREEELIRADHNLEMQLLDLDTISSRSLQLLRSMIAMATLVSLIWWWSKMHPAFSFLETVQLWSIGTVTESAYSVQSVTLGRGLLVVVLVVITAQLVRNLSALLELALLQHLDLSPGTSYAITTLTKYLIILVGSLVGISLLGIDWPKIQWVATALGVGLGFGLKDIFANFISGLILLFEKPIRIGDTVTVRELTGTVTKINTRATVITDWDRKEVIVPNHALITEQFVNWTLADTITRIVLQIGAPADVDPLFIKKLIKRAAKKCTLLLDTPPLDIYLNELQQGIQCFEVRLYAAEPGHRMPLRHEFHQRLLALYRRYHIVLPYPPTQIRIESMVHEDNTSRLKTAARRRPVVA